MNTEEKFVHPDIQVLKSETSPTTLRARILNQLESREESKMRNRSSFLKLSVSTAVIATIAVGTLMLTNTANAIPRIKAALQEVTRYHVRSFQTMGGKRQLVSQTWVDGKNEHVAYFDGSGKEIKLDPKVVDLTAKMSSKIKMLPAAKIAKGDVLGRAIKDVILTFNGEVKGGTADMVFTSGSVLAKPIKDKIQIQGSAIDVQGSTIELNLQGGEIEIALLPVAIGGENGVQYLRQLLEDKELWNIERGVGLNGRNADRYTLKDGLVNFTLFVDPVDMLPILTRTVIGEGADQVTIEDEYDYTSVMPKPKK